LTEARVLPTQRMIVREDKRIGRPIVLQLEKGKETEARERLERVVRAVDLPERRDLRRGRRPERLRRGLRRAALRRGGCPWC